MRVLFLVTDYPSEKGPAKCIFHKTQADALARLGVVVDVVAPIPAVPFGLHVMARRWRDYHAAPARYRLGQVDVYRPRYMHWPLRMHLGPGAGRSFGRAALRALSVRWELVHAHFAYPPGSAATWLSRRLRVPFVLTLHGSDVNIFPDVNSRMRSRFVKAVRSANAVIAVSEALAERTSELSGRRPTVMPIGIQLDRFRHPPSKEAARQSLGVPATRPLAVYVGHLSSSKGIGELLEALKRLVSTGVEGIVVGDGPLRANVEEVGNIHYFGPQPNERVPLFMAAADVLVLPSYSEGLPTVLVEAGAVGVPIIGSAVGGITELLEDGRGLLISPRSVDALVGAIRAVLSDREAAAERAAHLSRHVAELYDVDKNAVSLLQVYQGLL